MTTRVTISTKGMEATLERLAQQSADVDAAVADGLQAAGEILLDGMRRRAPVETGKLRDSLALVGPLRFDNVTLIYVGLNRGTPGDVVRYAMAQEFGSVKMPGHPFIRPTVQADMRKARAALMDALQRHMGGDA